jgi:hypothetical protein
LVRFGRLVQNSVKLLARLFGIQSVHDLRLRPFAVPSKRVASSVGAAPPAGAERSSAVSLALRYTAFAMSVSRRYFAPGQLQFITSSVYRRLKLFDSDRLRLMFVEVLREYRQQAGFLLVGWVLMPEHFHFLIKPAGGAYVPTFRRCEKIRKWATVRALSR